MTRLIPFLTLSCVALGGVYLALVACTVFFAQAENTLAAEVRDAETRLASLEAEYYDAIGALSALEPETLGLSAPSRVVYVSENGSPALSRAE